MEAAAREAAASEAAAEEVALAEEAVKQTGTRFGSAHQAAVAHPTVTGAVQHTILELTPGSLVLSTDSFAPHSIIGRGGFGVVHAVFETFEPLPHVGPIAVKRLTGQPRSIQSRHRRFCIHLSSPLTF